MSRLTQIEPRLALNVKEFSIEAARREDDRRTYYIEDGDLRFKLTQYPTTCTAVVAVVVEVDSADHHQVLIDPSDDNFVMLTHAAAEILRVRDQLLRMHGFASYDEYLDGPTPNAGAERGRVAVTATTVPVAVCPAWCNTDHAAVDEYDDGRSHGRTLASGAETGTHGPLYRVDLQETNRGTDLFVEVNSSTLTADQAEVLGRALVEGAADRRVSRNAAQGVALHAFEDVNHRWRHFDAQVFPPTTAEQKVSRAERGEPR